VLAELSLAAGAAHAEIFERSAKPGELMSFEMGAGYQGISVHNLSPDVYLFEYSLVNPYLFIGIAPYAVSDDERGIHHCIVEAVFNSDGKVGDGITPLSPVEGIGIGEKWFCLALFDPVYNLPDEDGPDKSSISLFASVQLYGNQVTRADSRGEAGLVQQGVNFVKEIPLYGGFQAGKKYLTLHGRPLIYTTRELADFSETREREDQSEFVFRFPSFLGGPLTIIEFKAPALGVIIQAID